VAKPLLNVHGINYVRQTEIHTADSLVAESSIFQVEIAAERLKRRSSLGSAQIPVKLIKAGGRTIHSEIQKAY
jgi:hypothetical protein